MTTDLVCPNCGAHAVCVDSEVVYGTSYGLMWQCPNCPDHYVGCHRDSDRPLGTLCGHRVRRLRQRCHQGFDRLWKGEYARSGDRDRAYRWLAEALGLPEERAHIAMLDETNCLRLLSQLSVEKGIDA